MDLNRIFRGSTESQRSYPPFRVGLYASVLCLILQPIVFFWHVLVDVRTHIPYDIEIYHFPLIDWIARCVRHGWWPFWDPNTYGGMPLNADLQAQLFYPPTWFVILAGNLSEGRNLFYWVECLIPLHMVLAGLFTFALLRRMRVHTPSALFGATVYQLGGFFASQATHLGAISTGAWLPLCLLGVYELKSGLRLRWFATLAFAVAMSILSGYAATTAVVLGATVLFLLALMFAGQASWRTGLAFLAACALATAICAVQLVPLLQLTRLSIASGRSRWLTAWGAPAESMVSLVFPDHYHIFELSKYTLHWNYTFLYVYCGLATFALLLAAPFLRGKGGPRMFFGLAVLSGVWMLGEHTPVYGFVVGFLPSMVRGGLYAWYAMMAFTLFAAIGAALVLDHFSGRLPRFLLWSIVLFTSWDLIHTGRDRPMNSAPGGYFSSSSEYQYQGDPVALQKLRALVDVSVPPQRIDYADGWAPGIMGAGMLGLPTSDGNIPFMLRRMFLLRRLFADGKPDLPSPLSERDFPVIRFDSPLLRMLNVGIVASLFEVPDDKATRGGLLPIGRISDLHLYRVSDPLPRFYFVATARRSQDESDAFALLARDSFAPATEAIVEGIPADRTGLAGGSLRVDEYSADRVRLSLTTAGPAFLATSEPLYPGWEATVETAGGVVARPLLMTNGVFRGLEIKPGDRRVTMTYRPQNLYLAATVSIFALLVTAALGLWGPRLNRENTARMVR